jgi:hypothetical protein
MDRAAESVPTTTSDGRPVGPARPDAPNPHGAGGVGTAFPALKSQPKGHAVLAGHLDHKTQATHADAVLGGIEIRLFAFGNKERVGEWRTETDEKGDFEFTGLSADPNLKYISSALYQGVVYLSEGTAFAAGSKRLETSIQVYDSAPGPGQLSIDSMHVILQLDPGSGAMQVTEVTAFNNPSELTLVGSAEDTLTLQMDMPAGASNVQVMQGLLPAQVFLQEKALTYTGPIYPGTNQVVIGYQVAPLAAWMFRRRLPFRTESVDVFVPKNGPAVLSPQLAQQEPITIQGTTFDRYSGGPFAAGGGVSFQIGGAEGTTASSSSSLPAVPLATAIGALTLLFVIWPLTRRGKILEAGRVLSPRERQILELIRQRDLEMAAVREIDFDHESGKLSDEDHQKLRERHKQAAIVAMQGLAALGIDEQAERSVLLSGAAASGAPHAAPHHEGPPGILTPELLEQARRLLEASAAAPATGPATGPSTSPEGLSRPSANDVPTNNVPGTEARAGLPLRFCTECGTPIEPGDKFCGSCGARLRVANG